MYTGMVYIPGWYVRGYTMVWYGIPSARVWYVGVDRGGGGPHGSSMEVEVDRGGGGGWTEVVARC